MSQNVVVLGAGMVGICCAIELRRRGHTVTLLDRNAPARETSWGNAGVLAGGSIQPEASPDIWRRLPHLLLNRGTDVHLHYRHLPRMTPFLRRFLANTRQPVYTRNAGAICALLDHAVSTHVALANEAGVSHLVKRRGWLKLYRSASALARSADDEQLLAEHGVEFTRLDPAAIAELEPALSPIFAGGRWITGAATVSNPGALGTAYAELFRGMGGRLETAEVRALRRVGDTWQVETHRGRFSAARVIVALGAWTPALLAPLGYRLPVVPERGYHQHYRPPAVPLNRPIHDIECGFVLAPMEMGYRLTTGVEWARLGAPPTPLQLARTLPRAREAVPIGEPVGDTWLGNRPQTPDTLPVIGEVPGQPDLWLATGHGHLGLSLGPITGILLAGVVSGESSDVDLSPYAPSRFR